MWSRTKIVLNNGTTSYSPSSNGTCIAGATGATGTKGDKGDQGETGVAAQSFQIVASSPTYPMSSRGVILVAKSITLTCIKANIPEATTVTWECPSLGVSGIIGVSITLTLPYGSELAEIPVTCTITGFSAQTLRIQGVKDGDAVPVYLHVLSTSDPAISEHFQEVGGKFITGDYFLYSTQAGNFPKWYDGVSWNIVDETTPNYGQIMGTIIGDALKSPYTIPSTSALYGYFENFAANNAFIKKLLSLYLELQDGGAIYHGYSADGESLPPNGAGFWFGANGVFKALQAILLGCISVGAKISTSDNKARMSSTVSDIDEDGFIMASEDIDNPTAGAIKTLLGHTRSTEPGLKSYYHNGTSWEWISEFVSFVISGISHSDWSCSGDNGATKGMISLIEDAVSYACILTNINLFAPSGDGDTNLGEEGRRFNRGLFNTVNTGNGDCEVYKISNASLTVNSDTNIPSMIVGEIRFISAQISTSKYLLTPVGGSYVVVGSTMIGTYIRNPTAGNSKISYGGQDGIYTNMIIRRIA
jgi:hypothetical protein